MKKNLRVYNCILCIMAVYLSSCLTEYNFDRTVTERGTLGEEVYQVLHQDTRWSPRNSIDRKQLLEREREEFIIAIDQIIPADIVTDLDLFLRAIAPLQDNNLIPDFTRKISDLLLFTKDQTATHEIISQYIARQKYTAFNVEYSLLGYLTQGPQLSELIQYLLRIISQHDGFDDSLIYTNPTRPTQATNTETQTITQLLTLCSEVFKTTEITSDSERFAVILTQILLYTDARFNTQSAGMWAVHLTEQGTPKILQELNRTIQVFDQSETTRLGYTRDELGRAIIPNQGFIFDYIDLKQTALGFLLRQMPTLIEKEIPFHLIELIQKILPPRESFQSNQQTWQVYSELNHLLLELSHATLTFLNIDILDELLEISVTLMNTHKKLLADLRLSLEKLNLYMNEDSSKKLIVYNTLFDDLIDHLIPMIAEEGFLDDLLIAMQDPIVTKSKDAFIDMLRYKAQRAVPSSTSDYHSCFQTCENDYLAGSIPRFECIRLCPNQDIMTDLVDHQLPATEGNRSHWERTLALFRTTAGVSYEMKVLTLEIPQLEIYMGVENTLPALLRIDDVAAAYIEAVVGNLDLKNYITEEAILSSETDLLLDALENMCGSSLLDHFIQALLPELVNITPQDIVATCDRLVEVSSRTDLSNALLKRHKLSVMVSFLSMLTDVSMDEKPKASQLARFFNLPNPSLDLNVARLNLSQITDRDGYLLWQHHGDMLYAAEASGLLDSILPIFKVFSKYGMTAEFAGLMALLDQHYPTINIQHWQANGQPAPRTGDGTGLVIFEYALLKWLSSTQFFDALHQFAIVGETIMSSRNTSMNQLITTFIRHSMQQDMAITKRDGSDTHIRKDGRSVPNNRLFLLVDALSDIETHLIGIPEALEQWEHVVDTLVHLFLAVEEDNDGHAYFTQEGSLALAVAFILPIIEIVHRKRDTVSINLWLQEVYLDIEKILTHRFIPLLIDVYHIATYTAQDKQRVHQWLTYIFDPQAYDTILPFSYDILTVLLNETLSVQFTHDLADLINPQQSWNQPLPLLSHITRIMQDTIVQSPNQFVSKIIHNMWTTLDQLDDTYPITVLLTTLVYYHRQDPMQVGVYLNVDYQYFIDEMSQWLRDDQYGMEQVYDLVKSRIIEVAQ